MAVIPLPQVVPNTPEEGWVNNTIKNINALRKQNLENQFYAPLAQADMASKLAYAQYTPAQIAAQFLAKLLGNDSVLANIGDDKAKQAINSVYQAGTGQGGGFKVNAPINAHRGDSAFNAILNYFGNYFNKDNNQNNNNALSQSVPTENNSTPQPTNAFLDKSYLSNDDQKNINNLKPGDSYVVKGTAKTINPAAESFTAGEVLPISIGNQSSVAENTGKFKGIVKEGEEAGAIRAKDIDDLNNLYAGSVNTQNTLDSIGQIVSSPDFEEMRRNPLAGHYELDYYEKFGTPAQQEIIGNYKTLLGQIIKDSAQDFKGQFRVGEQNLLNSMKPNPSDTVNTARGKLEALSYLNKMMGERSQLTAKIMNKYHVNKGDALEAADKQINGEEIRQSIRDKLNPTVTIKNKKTGELKTISRAEARKLGVPNV